MLILIPYQVICNGILTYILLWGIYFYSEDCIDGSFLLILTIIDWIVFAYTIELVAWFRLVFILNLCACLLHLPRFCRNAIDYSKAFDDIDFD